ncbi:penicillin acylase family protein [Pseudoalteromonas sp. OANN1]|uniref:penicillin acylase family protein n=1 Tax=Pseudoalteromonas sp. OANN1 TaxID=2954497 RepID=UPI002097F5B1|nr:penicillin acylase family protein [Pseudoalteromonas sp. OANN1]MCO7199080.1 penicillin acylase family protein [Pseudoalteromonas sp. OANN1]
MKKFFINLALSVCALLSAVIYVYFEYLETPDVESGQVIYGEGISEAVTIAFDEYGIASINAKNESDLYFSMGYLHAKDRLWQLEVQRRIAAGRSAEVFGKTSVNLDAWMRTLGLYRSAEKTFPILSSAAQSSLQAYADGINSYVSNNTLPFEFKLFNIEPEPWSVVDSLAWSKVFALNLAGNFRNELQRQVGLRHLTPSQLAVFFPQDQRQNLAAEEQKSKLEPSEFSALLEPTDLLEQYWKIGGKNVGSNAWVVSGKHTDSGAPILANDPHLGLQIPSLWYAVKQTTPAQEVTGMSLVGLPVVIFGRNKDISWGGTNMMADVQDLVVHQIHPEDPNQYLIAGQWHRFDERVEKIKVKADFPAKLRNPLKPVEVRIRESKLGPIVSDIVPEIGSTMSLRWVALDENDTTYESFFRLNKANNWQSFLNATKYHIAPALNLFYADKANNIGFKAVGRVPKRSYGDGTLPFRFSVHKTATDNWNGYIPFEQMPTQFNPESGFLFNANNSNVPKGYPYVISNDFAHPARGQRIEQLLSQFITEQQKITVSDTMQMQVDTLDLSSLPLLNVLQSYSATTKLQTTALEKVIRWDGYAKDHSIGSTIYYAWLYHIKKQLFGDELQGFWNNQRDNASLNKLPGLVAPETIAELLTQQSVWCDDITTEVVENCNDVLQLSFSNALNDLSSIYGDDPENWQWGKAQQVVYKHIPFSNMRVFDYVFERRFGSGGAPNALHATTSTFDKNEGFETFFGAGFRQVIQMSDEQQHYLINSTGQSEKLTNDHYDDLAVMFAENKFIGIHSTKTKYLIKLLPASTQESLQ